MTNAFQKPIATPPSTMRFMLRATLWRIKSNSAMRTARPLLNLFAPALVMIDPKFKGALNAHYFAFDRVQHIHDPGMVRPPEIQEHASDHGHSGELADCPGGILFPGAGEPHRLRGIHRLPAQDHSGNYYARGFRYFRLFLSGRATTMELRSVFRLHPGCRGICVLGETINWETGFRPGAEKSSHKAGSGGKLKVR